MTERVLILTRGLQGSGKSTFAEQWVKESPFTRTRLNKDTIRFTYFNSYWGNGVSEEAVTSIEIAIASTLMEEGKRDFVVDNTHLKPGSLDVWIEMAEKFGYKVEVKDFDVPLDELLRRDASRDKPVGADVICSYYEQYLLDGKLPALV